jgi:hypothetical protein
VHVPARFSINSFAHAGMGVTFDLTNMASAAAYNVMDGRNMSDSTTLYQFAVCNDIRT